MASPDPAPLRAAPPPATAPRLALLVVDDEVRSLEALRRTLDEEFTVFTATGADEARAVLEREPVAIVLCDQRMPGTTGVEFLKDVRSRWPDAIRIVISGYTEKRKMVVDRYSSPGRSTVLGNCGWFGESGKCCVSRQKPKRCSYFWPDGPVKLPSRKLPV